MTPLAALVLAVAAVLARRRHRARRGAYRQSVSLKPLARLAPDRTP